MKTRKLGLEKAFELASILSKYVDSDPNKDALEFISEILEKLTPEEYIHCVKLLTDKEEIDVKEQSVPDILSAFIEGLRLNSIVSLVGFYKSLGF